MADINIEVLQERVDNIPEGDHPERVDANVNVAQVAFITSTLLHADETLHALGQDAGVPLGALDAVSQKIRIAVRDLSRDVLKGVTDYLDENGL